MELANVERTPDQEVKRRAKMARRWRARILLVLAIGMGLPLGVTILLAFPPTRYSLTPPCYLHFLTGLHCPGCGMTRCAYALLTGDLPQAFAFNAMFVVFVPLIMWVFAQIVISVWTGKSPRYGAWPAWVLINAAVLLFVFGIVRNIPCEPFSYLAPHELER